MPRFSLDEIRNRFSTSTDFNDLFDAFQDALEQKIQDLEVYRLLFWNKSLSSDELCLFGEKLAMEFPPLAYEIFMWMASIFEATFSAYDNFELAIEYYQKAAHARPSESDPYLDACDCYDPDLNIPPIDTLIDFLIRGSRTVKNKKPIYVRLSRMYEMVGDIDRSEYYRGLADEIGKADE
ncbi:MAG: hypothetical protein FJ215_06140 [Ignavibacteria bacterium]|nr:hypothetical protein [Ignavibacteria bacterium]